MSDTVQMIQARRINSAGRRQLSELLGGIRHGKLDRSSLSIFVHDVEYTEEISEELFLNASKTFLHQQDMIDYFLSVLNHDLLVKFRKDSGFWTWLAILYREQFLKARRGQPGADCRWIYDIDNFRDSRRHYIAGPIYLSLDFESSSPQTKEILFGGPITAFGGMRDSITLNQEMVRHPALTQVATWLYYDPNTQGKVKSGATNQKKPGTIRDLTHVSGHFAKTLDIHGVEDAPILWNLLPPQFNKFKGNAVH